MFDDSKLTPEQRRALQEADDHADRVYMDGPDEVMNTVKDMRYQEMAEKLMGFGGSEGTGEELHDYLTTELGWDDEDADDFLHLVREGVLGELDKNPATNENTGDFLYYIALLHFEQ